MNLHYLKGAQLSYMIMIEEEFSITKTIIRADIKL